jgi:hypothetical protein
MDSILSYDANSSFSAFCREGAVSVLLLSGKLPNGNIFHIFNWGDK